MPFSLEQVAAVETDRANHRGIAGIGLSLDQLRTAHLEVTAKATLAIEIDGPATAPSASGGTSSRRRFRVPHARISHSSGRRSTVNANT
jgi:hypothetical protein